jgi:hypothetical protein
VGIDETTTGGAPTFMAECFWPGVSVQALADAGARARRASRAITSNRGFARYLGSILIPADEIALCLFEATSIGEAAEVNRQAAIPSERILEIVRLGAFAEPARPFNSSTKEHR